MNNKTILRNKTLHIRVAVVNIRMSRYLYYKKSLPKTVFTFKEKITFSNISILLSFLLFYEFYDKLSKLSAFLYNISLLNFYSKLKIYMISQKSVSV